MTAEHIRVNLPQQPEYNPALQGCCPPPASAQRYADDLGQTLLRRVVAALRAGLTVPTPANAVQNRTERSVLDAGERFPAIDPARLAAYQADSHRLQGRVTGDLLLGALRAVTAGLGGLLRGLRVPAPPLHPVQAAARPRGVLDYPSNYWQQRAAFYGAGL